MLYLNKFLIKMKENPTILKKEDVILNLGLTKTQIKDLKKYALENQLITQNNQKYFLSQKGEIYLLNNPLLKWENNIFPQRPRLNFECLKEEKTPARLTKAIRNIAKHFLEKEAIKDFSVEQAILNDLKNCKMQISDFEKNIFTGKKESLNKIFEKYTMKGFTKSLISLILLKTLTDNIDKLAIYEKSQFQLNFNSLMFDRMIACPQNFEIQKTKMPNDYLLQDISKIILNKKSDNILEITKGLYKRIKKLDKYTINTENLTSKTLRFRNVILNAKDPIKLFERDIPKVFDKENLKNCDTEFLYNFKKSINELEKCSSNLLKEIKKFILKSFHTKTKQELFERFLTIKEYIDNKELKILYNTILEIDVPDDLWINRIATVINKFRIPKDWSDEDYANFKIKTKELTLNFLILESIVGFSDATASKKCHSLLKKFLSLPKTEQNIFLHKIINY